MKKIYLIFLVMFLAISLIGVVNAQASYIGIFPKSSCIGLQQICSNCTYVNLTTVFFPNSSYTTIGEYMTKAGQDYSFQYCNTSTLGTYRYNVCGDKDGTLTCETITFQITPNGLNPATPAMEIFILLMFVFICLALLVYLVLNIVKLIMSTQTIYGTLVSLCLYAGLVMLYYFASNFLLYDFITNFSLVLIKTMWFTHGFLPFLSLIITMIKKSFDKKKFIGIDELTGRKLLKYG